MGSLWTTFANALAGGMHSLGPPPQPGGAGPSWIIALIVCALFATFIGALWVVYKIWMTVIDVVANKSADKSNRLAAILGKSEVGVEMKGVRAKAVGVGLSATIAILALAVAAMWVLNNQTVT